jgi:hypothetical protein
MLVFFKYPKGSTMLNGRRIYGFLENHGPVVVPWNVYRTCKNSLIQASYNKEIFEQLFPGIEFPNLSFTYHQIRFLSWEDMCSLCKAFGITTSRSNQSRRQELRKFMRENC